MSHTAVATGSRTQGLPARVLKRAAQLLNLQCWVWGQDIRRSEGNLLLAAGLERLRPPGNVHGCSQYTAHLGGGLLVKLWGFGLYCGNDTGCYLNRYEGVPRAARCADCWTAEGFATAPRTLQLTGLPEALRWIAAYEAGVCQQLGPQYRRHMAGAGPASGLEPAHLSAAWSGLAGDLERWLVQRAPA